eukprot:scaffold8900_cov119-Isochrysis_galbana.AAC.6
MRWAVSIVVHKLHHGTSRRTFVACHWQTTSPSSLIADPWAYTAAMRLPPGSGAGYGYFMKHGDDAK